ncbi:peptide ABC transporter substrate-binding protein [Streptomyces sp. NPDC090083]|uniref:peptide ABC transporter substrate-binding protein n=1 Tax=Streptomyces sp. NPDC090083 TaxID=3365941 RepID=UPI00380D1E36
MNHPLTSPSERPPGAVRRRALPLAAACTALGLGLSGCTSGDTGATGASPVTSHGVQAATAVRQGGSLVIGAEQEPDCADWIATCAGSIWGTYIMETQTIPHVFTAAREGSDWVPEVSGLMASEPTISGGARPKITYKLNPKAVWSDGKPITSADLKYTALQIRDGKDIFEKTGYTKIASVDTPDERTAVVTLKESYGNWKDLFSGEYGVLPSHLLQGRDRDAIMKNGYTFSGGPWKIQKWIRGTSVTLVPNDRYWGRKPHLDKVTFQFTADTAAAFQAFRSGQLDALYPSPQLDVIDQITSGLPKTDIETDAQTGNLEALWMNNARFPFDSVDVRRAIGYAVDRKALVERLYGPLGVKQPAQSFNSPLVSRYAGTDFSSYVLDLKKVDQIMKGAGWAKGGDGIWAKGGRKADFTIVSLAGNKRRELTEQVLQAQLKNAGFAMRIKNTTAANLFSKVAPAGDFQLGLWTIVDSFPEPTLDASFASGSIPSAANGQAGINFMRARVPGLDGLLDQVAADMDETTRVATSLKADKLIAQDVPALPLGTVPNVLLWNKRVGGKISINPVRGPWWNLEDWGLAK